MAEAVDALAAGSETTSGPREVLTYEHFGLAVRDLAQQIHDTGYRPDWMVAIARGGLIIGGAIGGLIGRAAAPGIDGNFVKEVEAQLPPGGSAIFLLTKGGGDGLLIAAMREFEGTVIQTSLDDEQEAALRASLK